MPEAIAPLRIPRFRALWGASILSNLGSFLQAVAASWLMLELTDSATWVGLITASTTLPLLFLALAAGAVADLVDRTRVLQISQILMGASAAAMAVATWTGVVTPGILLGLGLLLGVGVAFNLPAWQALVPDLVPRGMVAGAVALNSVAFNVARAVGPALGGLVVATAGAATGFGLNALSYLGVIAVVTLLGRSMSFPAREQSSITNAIALGIRYARYTPSFRRLLLVVSLFALTSAVVQAVLPSLTRDELGGGAGTYGLLLGALGAGALGGAFTRDSVVGRLGPRSIPATIAVFGLAGIGIGVAPVPAAAVPFLLVAGACWVWTLITLNSTAQLMVPEWVRGRAMSLYSLAFVGVVPLGSILAGVVADGLGERTAYVGLSAAGVAVGLIAPRMRLPLLAEIEPPEFTQPLPVPEHADTEGGPVMVVNTWVVDTADVEAFLDIMTEVRLVRLRTGAYRWRLYRNAADPHRLTEVFMCVSWEEHLAQHGRIDDASAALLVRARAFDRTGGPVTRHLVAVDVEEPHDWEVLVSAHEELHRVDGSIPLGPEPARSEP